MEKKIPIYEIEIDMLDETGVDLISIVQDPAIMVKGITLNKHTKCDCGDTKEIELGGKPGLVHPNCKCQIIDGKWKFSVTPDKKYPCEICRSAAGTYKSFGTFEDVFNNVYGFNLSKQEIEKVSVFFAADKKKKKIVGPALIPGYKIYRNDSDGEYFITFSVDTIEKIVEKFNKSGQTKKINFNHTPQMVDAYINQSWIIETEQDKSKDYGFNLPKGTWMLEVKVEDDSFWRNRVEGEDFYSFSIEGILGLKKVEMKQINLEKVSFDFDGTLETEAGQQKAQELIDAGDELFIVTARNKESENLDLYEIAANLNIPEQNIVFTNGADKYPVLEALGISTHYDNNTEQIKKINDNTKVKGIKLESYNDYPKAAQENAQRALDWVEKNGWGDCGTPVGKIRANQLANGENLTEDTIGRMAAFERHRQNSNTPYGEGCGKLMWDAWGGDEGIAWAQRKLEQIKKEKLESQIDEMSLEDLAEVFDLVIEPKSGETETEFISRCIPFEIGNGYEQDQAAAICYSKWSEKK